MLAKAGTSVVRLLKLVRAFCSIVSGWSRAPSRWVWAFHSSSVGELAGEMRLPEGDVADAADPEDDGQLGPLRLQLGDPLGVLGQAVGRGEPALRLGHGPVAERAVEGRLHRVLERPGVVGGEGRAVAVAPLVHVEAVDVVAGDAPLLEEVDRPAVHSHRADRQDQGRRAGPASRVRRIVRGDLVAEHHVEVGERRAGDRLEVGVPPGLALV